MKPVLVMMACLVPGVAHADIAGALSAGAGGESSARSGFATATATATAQMAFTPLRVEDRGLCDPDHGGCLWLFTGLDPDEVNGAGATAEASFHVRSDGDLPTSLFFTGRTWAAYAGWQLEGSTAFQPIGSLRETFWRSGRAVLQTTAAIDIPPMWSLGTMTHQLIPLRGRIAIGKRSLRQPGSWSDAGFDRDVSVQGLRWQAPSYAIDSFGIRYVEYGVAQATIGATTYGTSAIALDFDLVGFQLRLGPDVEISAHGGFSDRMPVAPFMQIGSGQLSSGSDAMAPAYWVDARFGPKHDANGDEAASTLTLGGGRLTRLDPSGHAVDDGHLVSLAIQQRLGKVHVRSDVEIGVLRRILLGALAPIDLAPVGTRMWIGRGSLAGTLPITADLTITATGWVERSDRDDPRWTTPGSGALTTHSGADLLAVWRFGHL